MNSWPRTERIELWTLVIAVLVLFLWLGGQRMDTLKGPYFVSLACFWFLFGMVCLMGHSISRSSVELLKEGELQCLEKPEFRSAPALDN